MIKSFKKIFATVFTTESGYHKVMLPSGEIIPHDVKSVTVNAVGYSEVTVTFLCNVVPTKEDALEKYKK
jgi:hypothetical protein